MISCIIVLFFLLGIQRSAQPDDLLKDFVVRELAEQSLTGCTLSAQLGATFDVDPFHGANIISNETTLTKMSSWAPIFPPPEEDVVNRMMLVPVDPPNPDPNPDPPTPPVTMTPEPPTYAILGMTAAVLLFLLFGWRRAVGH